MKHQGKVKNFLKSKKYKALEDGSIISYRNKDPKVLKWRRTGRGYYSVVMGRHLYAYVHQVVWLQFNERIPDGLTINHKNGIKSDNRIENLELLTKKQNSRHGADLGLFNRRNNESKVRLVKKLLVKGWYQKDIAKQVGWTQGQISCIKRGKIYSWVD